MEESQGFVFLLKPVGNNVFMIGHTSNLDSLKARVTKRIKRTSNFVAYFQSRNAEKAARALHQKYGNFHLAEDWFILPDSVVPEICTIKDWQI